MKLLLQLADTLVEKGHAHAPNIKSWVEEVDDTYKNFSTRMDKYREKVTFPLNGSIFLVGIKCIVPNLTRSLCCPNVYLPPTAGGLPGSQ